MEFTSQPVRNRPRTCHVCGSCVAPAQMALHQNRCIKRNILSSSNFLVTMDGSPTPPIASPSQFTHSKSFKAASPTRSKLPAAKRSLSDIPMPSSPKKQTASLTTHVPAPASPVKQTLRRIPIPVPSNRVAEAAEATSHMSTSTYSPTNIPQLAASATNIRFQRPEMVTGSRAREPAGGASSPVKQQQHQYQQQQQKQHQSQHPEQNLYEQRVKPAQSSPVRAHHEDYVDYSCPEGLVAKIETAAAKVSRSVQAHKHQQRAAAPEVQRPGSGSIRSTVGCDTREREDEVPESTVHEMEDDGQARGGYDARHYEDAAREESGELDESDRTPCPRCGRKFAGEARLTKHVAACAKLKQRKVFDVAKARVRGTDLEQYAAHKKTLDAPHNGSRSNGVADRAVQPAAKKKNWRVKHETFIRMVRANRDDGTGGGPPAPSLPDPDYVQCEHCGRRFNEMAAERHIPICANTKHRPKPAIKAGSVGAAVAEDEARMRKRLDFKPPVPKGKKSPERKR
ncbi:hypothetical protein BC830DRAFT_1120319 [Chytriomyces sp. MP71]|nr:hypothetical protein BC830DRAFT_1120319 [Chytriomyces sp. MP71]